MSWLVLWEQARPQWAQKLAERLQMPMIDTDDIVVEDSGMDIPDIFARYGEVHFRDLENAAVRKAANLENHVISTGGGVVLRESNLEMLKRNGVVFCLTATAEEIWRRVGSETHRPLLQAPNPLGNIEQMLIERSSLLTLARLMRSQPQDYQLKRLRIKL